MLQREGVRVLAAGFPDQRAISATVSSSAAEMLNPRSVRPVSAARRRRPRAIVVDVGEGARLGAGAEDLKRPLAGEDLADQVGDGVRDPRLVGGVLAGARRR